MPPKPKQTNPKAAAAKPQMTQAQAQVQAKFNEAFALHQKGQLTPSGLST